MNYKTWLEIDSKALLCNLNFFKKTVGSKVKIMAVIKANAYGHGTIEVAKILAIPGLWFGVDSLDEAIILKNSGIKNPIMILGFVPEKRFGEAIENNFRLSVYNIETLKMALKFPKGLFHLKVETGTNRLGLPLNYIVTCKLPNFEGVYTHFADVEDTKSNFYKKQITIFGDVFDILKSKNIFPKFIHSASTSAILRDKKTHFDIVRLGIGLYKGVLVWKAKVAQVKKIKCSDSVGYDRAFKSKKDMIIAVIPVGYYDGYDRRLSNNGEVLIFGKWAKILGRVCMNMMMVDVTKIENVKVGDEAILLGDNNKISAENIAKKIGTIDYEVLARLGSHLPRIIL